MAVDPYLGFDFLVEIDGFVRGKFRSVDGLSMVIEEILYREGGDTITDRKLQGKVTFADVTFERGMWSDTDMEDWMGELFDPTAPGGTAPSTTRRRNLAIFLLDETKTPVKEWQLSRGWPGEWSFGTLDAMANDVAIERMVIKHEGMRVRTLV